MDVKRYHIEFRRTPEGGSCRMSSQRSCKPCCTWILTRSVKSRTPSKTKSFAKSDKWMHLLDFCFIGVVDRVSHAYQHCSSIFSCFDKLNKKDEKYTIIKLNYWIHSFTLKNIFSRFNSNHRLKFSFLYKHRRNEWPFKRTALVINERN